jgi:hypothetical protein
MKHLTYKAAFEAALSRIRQQRTDAGRRRFEAGDRRDWDATNTAEDQCDAYHNAVLILEAELANTEGATP